MIVSYVEDRAIDISQYCLKSGKDGVNMCYNVVTLHFNCKVILLNSWIWNTYKKKNWEEKSAKMVLGKVLINVCFFVLPLIVVRTNISCLRCLRQARAYYTHFVSMKTSSCLTIFTDRPADSEVYSVMSCIHVHNHGNTHLHGPNIAELFCWMLSLSIVRESLGSELF